MAVLDLGCSIEHLSQPPPTPTPPTSCENAVFWAEIVDDAGGKHFTKKLRCKLWSCPFCQKKNSEALRDDILRGVQYWAEAHRLTDPKFPYAMKLLTFTLPGRAFRESHTTEEAERIFKAKFAKVIDFLRQHYELRDYVWVREYQTGGWAYVHLLAMGGFVWMRGVLQAVRDLWEGCLGMGNVDVKVIKNSGHAAYYLTKYVTKALVGGLKSSRVYSMSSNFKHKYVELKKELKNRWNVIKLGYINSDGSLGRVIWERGENNSLDILENCTLKELLNYFSNVGKGCQLKLFEEDLC